MKHKEFIAECKAGGLERAKELLRKFVTDGEPASFCDGATSRAMCREASNAITGDNSSSSRESKHGTELYFFMWGG